MDIHVKHKRYFGLFGTPADAVCGQSLTLRMGYVGVGVVDMVVAVASLWEVAFVLWDWEGGDAFEVKTVLGDLLAILAFPFALNGLLGLPNFDAWKISAYSLFKRLEFLTLFVYYPFFLQDLCSDGTFACDNYTLSLLWIIRNMYNFYGAYIVWSVDMRMRLNQLIVVLHGPEMAQTARLPS